MAYNIFLDSIIFCGAVSIMSFLWLLSNPYRTSFSAPIQDIVALVIQSVGGASASSAARDDGNTEK